MDEFGNIYLTAEGGTASASDLYVLSSTAVPEPPTCLLLALGILGAIGYSRRRRAVV